MQILLISQCLCTTWSGIVTTILIVQEVCGVKRDEIVNNANVTNDDNALLFKYKANLIANTEAYGTEKGVKIVALLKYLSNFWRSLEMPLINCKVELSLKLIENCVLTTAEIGANADATGGDWATIEVTSGKLYVSVVTLLVEDNVKLVKQLNEGFKRPIYWNKYMVIDNKVVEIAAVNAENHIREWLDSSYQGVKRLFVLSNDNTAVDDQVLLILSKNISFQELKSKITTSKLIEEIFMINQSMTRLSNIINRTRSWLHDWFFVGIFFFWKKITD